MPLCWIFLLKRRRALSKVSFSPTRTSANPSSPPTGGVVPETTARLPGVRGQAPLGEGTAPAGRRAGRSVAGVPAAAKMGRTVTASVPTRRSSILALLLVAFLLVSVVPIGILAALSFAEERAHSVP